MLLLRVPIRLVFHCHTVEPDSLYLLGVYSVHHFVFHSSSNSFVGRIDDLIHGMASGYVPVLGLMSAEEQNCVK